MSEPGYIYALINPSLTGLVKVGKTTRVPEERVRELSAATGVPTPFVLAFDVFVGDCDTAEDHLHALLERRGHRVAENREFFRAPLRDVIRAMLDVEAAHAEPFEISVPARTPADRSNAWRDVLRDAWAHYHGEGEALEDKTEAMKLFRHAARLGSAEALHTLGVMHRDGDGCRPDPTRAVEYFKEGAAAGSDVCHAEMALHYGGDGHADNARKCWARYFASDGFRDRSSEREPELVWAYVGTTIHLDLPLEHREALISLRRETIRHARERIRESGPSERPALRRKLRRLKRWLGMSWW